jgi:uncharacterized surface protein with fasciclin (FAS1) repeats
MFKKLISGVLLASLALATIAPVASASGVEGRGQVASSSDGVTRLVNFSAGNRNQLSTLITAATCPALGSTVTDIIANESITLFAPRNSAFRDLGRALGLGKAGINSKNVCSVDSLLGEGTLLTILGYHVAPAKIWYYQALSARGSKLTMLSGEPAFVKGKAHNVRIDGGKVRIKNIRSANALMHVIDRVMIPPSVEKALAS